MDIQEIQYHLRKSRDYKGDYLLMPEPKRLMLPHIYDALKLIIGQDLLVITTLLEEGYSPSDAAKVAWNEGSSRERLKEMGHNIISLTSLCVFLECTRRPSPVMTLRKSLVQRLGDLGVADDIPAGLMSLPGSSVYFELGTPDDRRSGFGPKFGGADTPFEGFYYIQRDAYVTPKISDYALDKLGMKRGQECTAIDIKLCHSPFNMPSEKNRVAFHDRGVCFTLLIPDPEEPLNSVIDKNLEIGRETVRRTVVNPDSVYGEYEDAAIREACELVKKAVLYMNSSFRKSVNQFDSLSLRKKFVSVGIKKKGKIKERLKRSYDKVLIGPDSDYIPIAERIAQIEETGKKAPHFRRGYLGVRWVGTGEDKVAKLRPVKPTLVNAAELSQEDSIDMKDYDIY